MMTTPEMEEAVERLTLLTNYSGKSGAFGRAVQKANEETLRSDLRALLSERRKMVEALEFYAEVENWHGVYMCGHGPMTEDWGGADIDPQYPDGKPGERARAALTGSREHG